ncbi:MAG: HlyD family efflux transporter periplasmic adaptor subunit [bacterium]
MEHDKKNIMEEQNILREEKAILREEKKLFSLFRKSLWLTFGGLAIVVIAVVGLSIFWQVSNNRVQIDNSIVSAPIVDIASMGGGILKELYVKNGDIVGPNTVLARVGNELIKTNAEAEIVDATSNIGKSFSSGASVIKVIDPSTLRVVGKLEEDKGLEYVSVGQRAIFTVDAFAGRQYDGVVDEISPTAHSSDVVFSISDKRAQNSFDVKVRFDVSKYPELKNGMSAKITVFKN